MFEREKFTGGINLAGVKRIKICFGYGKFELFVKNLSGDVEVIKYVRFNFFVCKMFGREI